MKLVLSKAYSERGADMGRRNLLPEQTDPSPPIKLRMEKLRWVDGDYDQGGAYWGYNGCNDVYCAWGEWGIPFKPVQIFVRALTRAEAKTAVREFLPRAKFYR